MHVQIVQTIYIDRNEFSILHSSGPIVGALAKKFGCRAVAICGSVIACVAYVISTFSPSVNVLILTYGAMGGKKEFTLQLEKLQHSTQGSLTECIQSDFTEL